MKLVNGKFSNDPALKRIVEEIEQSYKSAFEGQKQEQNKIEQWLLDLTGTPFCELSQEQIKVRSKYLKLLHVCVMKLKKIEGVFNSLPQKEADDTFLPISQKSVMEIETKA